MSSQIAKNGMAIRMLRRVNESSLKAKIKLVRMKMKLMPKR